jgi:hypothetical protein
MVATRCIAAPLLILDIPRVLRHRLAAVWVREEEGVLCEPH